MPEKNAVSPHDRQILHEKFKNGAEYDSAVVRLENHEPLAYIIGEWYFYDQVYSVSPDCLVPRPETEHLVDEVIGLLPQGGKFADLCTGCGCIAISSLAHRTDASALAVDISAKALKLANENAERNRVSDRIGFVCGNILEEDVLEGMMFDIIVSNPPYIASEVIKTLPPEVLAEPSIALDGGTDGLMFYRTLVDRYVKHINSGGHLIMEIGYDQGDALRSMCGCIIKKDYSGNDRVAVLKVK